MNLVVKSLNKNFSENLCAHVLDNITGDTRIEDHKRIVETCRFNNEEIVANLPDSPFLKAVQRNAYEEVRKKLSLYWIPKKSVSHATFIFKQLKQNNEKQPKADKAMSFA